MMNSPPAVHTHFVRFTVFTLLFTVGVILWGAFVRATGSGAGCGSHWPLCNGEIVPRAPELDTIIEFTHRLTSGAALLLVLVMLIWAWRLFPPRSLVRLAAGFTVLFMLTEALVGAALVLLGLVADDDSFARAWVMAFHLVNTFMLLGSLSLTAWWGAGKPAPGRVVISRRLFLPILLLLGVLLIAVSGAVAALGDTLFPSDTLAEALAADFSPESHLLIRLRVFHPLLALLFTVPIALLAAFPDRLSIDTASKRLVTLTLLLFLAQLGVGLANLSLLAPVALQLAHLLLADAIWVSAVLATASVLSGFTPSAPGFLSPSR